RPLPRYVRPQRLRPSPERASRPSLHARSGPGASFSMRRPSRSRPRTRRSQPTGLLVADRPFHVGPVWELRTAVLDGGELVVKRARRPSEATTALLAAEAA